MKQQSMRYRELSKQTVEKVKGVGADTTFKAVNTVVTQFVDLLLSKLAGGQEVSIPLLGKLKVVDTASRKRFNINTGEHFISPSNKRIKFYPSKRVAAKMVKGANSEQNS